MRIFTRYIAGKFLGPFLYGLGVFALLVFLGDLFDKMHKVATSSAGPEVIIEYLLLQMPYWTIRIIPMATLLAALFAVSGFVRSGEFVAVQAAGFRVGGFFRPLLWFSLLIALCGFVAQETIQPASYSRAQRLWRFEIHPERGAHRDAVYVIGQDRMLSAGQFLTQEGRMDRVVLDIYSRRGLRTQLDARRAHWDAARGVWVFADGVERRFDPVTGAVGAERAFVRQDSGLRTPPQLLKPSAQSPDTMSFFQIREYVARLRALGRPTHRALTGMHAKLAYPFTNLVLCALGIAVALRLRRVSRPVVFGAALVMSFFYIWLIEMGWYMGKAGRIPPLAAAWLANICFGALAVWMYRRIDA
ncbi:MAG: LptF/LptG family permease [Elusimicrobiota bacterium]